MATKRPTRRFVASIAVFVVSAVAAGAFFLVLQGMGLIGGAKGLLSEAQSDSPVWVTIGFVALAVVSASALVMAIISLCQIATSTAKRAAAAPVTAAGIDAAKEATRRAKASALTSTAAAGTGAKQFAETVQTRSRPVAQRGGRAARLIAARSAEGFDNLLDRAERRGQPALTPPATPALPASTGPATPALPASTGPATTPAGWYPCPYDVSRIRWFDGTEWSEHDRPAP